MENNHFQQVNHLFLWAIYNMAMSNNQRVFFSATPKKIDTLNPMNTVYIIIDFGLPIPSPVHIKHPLNETMFFCWEFSHNWDHYGVFDIRVMGL